MKRLVPAVIAVLITVALMGALYRSPVSADEVSAKQLDLVLQQLQKNIAVIDIALLQRIQVIEKKLKIIPPKDSLRWEEKK